MHCLSILSPPLSPLPSTWPCSRLTPIFSNSAPASYPTPSAHLLWDTTLNIRHVILSHSLRTNSSSLPSLSFSFVLVDSLPKMGIDGDDMLLRSAARFPLIVFSIFCCSEKRTCSFSFSFSLPCFSFLYTGFCRRHPFDFLCDIKTFA